MSQLESAKQDQRLMDAACDQLTLRLAVVCAAALLTNATATSIAAIGYAFTKEGEKSPVSRSVSVHVDVLEEPVQIELTVFPSPRLPTDAYKGMSEKMLAEILSSLRSLSTKMDALDAKVDAKVDALGAKVDAIERLQATWAHETSFFEQANGFGDISDTSESSASRQELPKKDCREAFSHTCPITKLRATPAEGGNSSMKVAHIVPLKGRHNQQLLNKFRINVFELSKSSNLLLLANDAEASYDRFGWTLVPTDDDASSFQVIVGTLQSDTLPKEKVEHLNSISSAWDGTRIILPDLVSRKMLAVHAMDFHRHHRIPFDPTPWKERPPRHSATFVVQQWLATVQ